MSEKLNLRDYIVQSIEKVAGNFDVIDIGGNVFEVIFNKHELSEVHDIRMKATDFFIDAKVWEVSKAAYNEVLDKSMFIVQQIADNPEPEDEQLINSIDPDGSFAAKSTKLIPRVFIESPFKGENKKISNRNRNYLRLCLLDSIKNHGENPYASHGLLTLALNDNDADERNLGLLLGEGFREVCEKTVVYTDLGVSEGMRKGIRKSNELNIPVEMRVLPDDLMGNLK